MSRSLLAAVADVLFPPICPVCRLELDVRSESSRNAPLCSECALELARSRITGPRCIHCGRQLFGTRQCCTQCATTASEIAGSAVYTYSGVARTLLRRYKFEGFGLLDRFIALELNSLLVAGDIRGTIVPIPSSRRAKRRNGWGHMERIAAELGRLGHPVQPGILRRKRIHEQKSLTIEERRVNMESAFTSGPTTEIYGASIILIDDVRTSGATLNAAGTLLRSKGATSVTWMVFALD